MGLQSGSAGRAWRCLVRTPSATGLTARYLVGLFCLILLLVPSAAIAQVVGSVTKVQKQAQIGSAPATTGTPVAMNDEIRTFPGARLQITFRDGTELTLGENATVVIDRYVYNPGASSGALAINATEGALRFVTGKLGEMRNKDVTVTTPQAALAVRGTDFWAGFIPGDYQYGVLLVSETGSVDVSNSAGSVTLSQAGEGTDIPPPLKEDYGPLDPYIWPADKVARALATTQFGLAFGPQNLLPLGIIAIPFIDPDPTSP